MIDPATTLAAVVGGCRLLTAAEWLHARRTDDRVRRDLLQCVRMLPPGSEVGEARPDGSHWWVRLPPEPSR
jgi:hypothetical protein